MSIIVKASTFNKLALLFSLALCADSAHAQGLLFKDITASARVGMPTDPDGFGVAVADFDNDGWPALYVGNSGRPSALLRNESTEQHRLKISPAGKESNSDGIGAIVQLEDGERTQTQQLIAGHSVEHETRLRGIFISAT